jgi:hypothetical protein
MTLLVVLRFFPAWIGWGGEEREWAVGSSWYGVLRSCETTKNAASLLGSVDNHTERHEGGGEVDEREVISGRLLVSRGNAAVVF